MKGEVKMVKKSSIWGIVWISIAVIAFLATGCAKKSMIYEGGVSSPDADGAAAPAQNQSRAGAGSLWPHGDDARGAAPTSRADSAETSGQRNRRLRDRKSVGRRDP